MTSHLWASLNKIQMNVLVLCEFFVIRFCRQLKFDWTGVTEGKKNLLVLQLRQLISSLFFVSYYSWLIPAVVYVYLKTVISEGSSDSRASPSSWLGTLHLDRLLKAQWEMVPSWEAPASSQGSPTIVVRFSYGFSIEKCHSHQRRSGTQTASLVAFFRRVANWGKKSSIGSVPQCFYGNDGRAIKAWRRLI